jgi:hypothetical protein
MKVSSEYDIQCVYNYDDGVLAILFVVVGNSRVAVWFWWEEEREAEELRMDSQVMCLSGAECYCWYCQCAEPHCSTIVDVEHHSKRQQRAMLFMYLAWRPQCKLNLQLPGNVAMRSTRKPVQPDL